MGRPKKIIEGSEELEAVVLPEVEKKDTIAPLETVSEDTVEIKKTDLDRMIKQMERQAKDIDLLYKASDKSRLAKAQNLEGEKLIKQCKVSSWADTGKFVVGWKLMTNKCEVVMGKWIEDQTVNVVLEDGETITTSLLEFYRNIIKKIDADIIKRREESDSNDNKITFLTLQFPSGKELTINSVFIN